MIPYIQSFILQQLEKVHMSIEKKLLHISFLRISATYKHKQYNHSHLRKLEIQQLHIFVTIFQHTRKWYAHIPVLSTSPLEPDLRTSARYAHEKDQMYMDINYWPFLVIIASLQFYLKLTTRILHIFVSSEK